MSNGFFAQYAAMGSAFFIGYLLINLILGIVTGRLIKINWVFIPIVFLSVIFFYFFDLNISYYFIVFLLVLIIVLYFYNKNKK